MSNMNIMQKAAFLDGYPAGLNQRHIEKTAAKQAVAQPKQSAAATKAPVKK